MVYSLENGKRIIDEAKSKGWNFYRTNQRGSLDYESAILRGPVMIIRKSNRYLVLPKVQDGAEQDFDIVMNALWSTRNHCGRNSPSIPITDKKRISITAIIPRRRHVDVLVPNMCVERLSYNGLLQRMATLEPTPNGHTNRDSNDHNGQV